MARIEGVMRIIASGSLAGNAGGASSRCFVQAEDGIRVLTVTGVQTCTLPIYDDALELLGASTLLAPNNSRASSLRGPCGVTVTPAARSEERRVGKDCRRRGRAR